MEEFVEGLMTKCGLSQEQADSVVNYIKENADKVPELLKSSGILNALPGGLGDKIDDLFD